jgi:hypothetical protein
MKIATTVSKQQTLLFLWLLVFHQTERVLAQPTTSRSCVNVTLDFETLPNGTETEGGSLVSGTEWSSYGVTVSALSSVNGSTASSLRLFDTANPSNTTTSLGSPNELCLPVAGPGVGPNGGPGEPGENCEPQGNVLILNESSSGGIIHFNFTDQVQTIHEIGLMDIAQDAVTTITVKYSQGVETINVVSLGTNAVQTIPINLDNVTELSVEISSSSSTAAVSFLRLCSTPVPAACSPERGFLGFLGVLMSSSIDNGTLDIDWEEAAFVSYNEIEPLHCNDPVFDVFLAPTPYNYSDATIPELIALAQTSSNGLMHIRTQELFLSLTTGLEQGANYSILVTASAEDTLYSDNRDIFDITISATDVVPNRNVTQFFGTFEASQDDDLTIDYNAATGLLYFTSDGGALDGLLGDLQVDYHLAVITTTTDDNYIFQVTAILEMSPTAVTLAGNEAALGDLIEELDFDTVIDTGRAANAVEAFSRRRRRRRLPSDTFSIFDSTLREEGTLVYEELTVYGLLELRAYMNVKVTISFRKLQVTTRITLGGTLKTVASVSWAKEVEHQKKFKKNIYSGSTVSGSGASATSIATGHWSHHNAFVLRFSALFFYIRSI